MSSHRRNQSGFDTIASNGTRDTRDSDWWLDEDDRRHLADTPSSTGVRRSKGSTASNFLLSSRKYSISKAPTRDKSRRKQQRDNLRAGMRVITDFSSPSSSSSSSRAAKPAAPPQVHKHIPQSNMLQPQTIAAPEQRQSVSGPQTSMSLFFNFDKDYTQQNAPPVPPVPSNIPNHNANSTHRGNKPTAGKFVNLNDLTQASDDHSKPKGSWWSSRGKTQDGANAGPLAPRYLGLGEIGNPSPRKNPDSTPPSKKIRGLGLTPLKTAKQSGSQSVAVSTNTLQLPGQGAAHGQSPDEPPAIVITPAREHSGHNFARPRATTGSSVYSQMTTYPSNHIPHYATETPPMPVDATDRWVADPRNHPANRDSDITILDDSSPLTAGSRESRSTSAFRFMHTKSQSERRLSSESEATKGSTGWWNTVLSPYLTRSNTLASKKGFSPIEDRPALPNLEKANAIAQQDREQRERAESLSYIRDRSKHDTAFTDMTEWELKREAAEQSQHPAHRNGHLQKEIGSVGFVPINEKENPEQWTPSSNPYSPPNLLTTATIKSQDDQFSPSDREVPMLFDTGISGPPPRSTPAPRPPPMNTLAFTSPQHSEKIMSPSSEIETPTVHEAGVGKFMKAQSPFPPAGKRADSLHTATPKSCPSSTLPPYSQSKAPIVVTAFSSSHAYPQSPSTISPSLRRAIAHTRGEPMSEVPLTPATRSQPGDFEHPSKQWPPIAVSEKSKKKSKDKKTSRIATKWKSTHPKKKKRICLGAAIVLLLILILSIALGVGLHKRAKSSAVQTQWLNLTNFPPIPTGANTIVQPDNVAENAGCVVPTSMWSCSVPRDNQQSILPNQPNQPNFNIQILYRNDTSSPTSKRSFIPSTLRSLLFRRDANNSSTQWTPVPSPPSLEDQRFLGSTTDNITSGLKEGEATPFYFTFQSSPSTPQRKARRLLRLARRDNDPFPDATLNFPPPSTSVDGTPSPANLLPLPSLQPLRLYDRGLPTEHYGFYTYFDRRIFLSSTPALLNATSSSPSPSPIAADVPGGAKLRDTRLVCTWAQTRLLVQIWTRGDKLGQGLIIPPNATTSGNDKKKSTSPYPGQRAADRFSQPGSFPYPVSVTTDRHGGDVAKKMVYCYGVDGRGHVVASDKVFQLENRGAFGQLVGGGQGPDGDKISVANGGLGGIDGGSGGCGCLWRNWRTTTNSS